jgi:hypothetical protein
VTIHENPTTTAHGIRQVSVTAAIARDWLARNSRNRAISSITVLRYRRDMLAGNWIYAADPVRFSETGALLDGQHRLNAIAGIDDPAFSIPLLIVEGLPEETQLVMDQGRKRNPGQQLGLLGIPNPNSLASAATFYLLWTSGILFKNSHLRKMISSPEVQTWVEANPEKVALHAELYPHVRKLDCGPRVLMGAAFRFFDIDPAATIQFVKSTADGAGLDSGDPRLALDKKFRTARRTGVRISDTDQLATVILAWNAWRDGRSVSVIRVPTGAFPTPH